MSATARADGDVASAIAAIAAADPLSGPMSLTDMQTVDELSLWRRRAIWCPDTLAYAVPDANGVYREHGDDRLLADVKALNEARLIWARDQELAAKRSGDEARAKAAAAYAAYVARSSSAGRMQGAARLWKACNSVPADGLNRDPLALGTPAGVVDIREAAALADLNEAARSEDDLRDPADALVTKSTRAELDGHLTGADIVPDPRWEEFVLEVMCGDPERAAYLKRALGYSIMGTNPEECMFVAYGPTTRNGKGTLLNSVAHALGAYAAAATPTFLLASRAPAGGTDEALASLAGCRLVTLSEPPEGRRLDEAKVKGLTGGDPQSTSRKYGHQFTFSPGFTMWMACNRLPAVEDTSVFASGRIRVVPFERHFRPEERDPTLKERFASRDGMAAILRWLLEGWREWSERGLDEPEGVRRATEAYAAVGGSPIRRFTDSECVLGAGLSADATALRDAYAAWCAERDLPCGTSQAMRTALEGLAAVKRKRNGRWVYDGIALAPESEFLSLDFVTAEPAARGKVRLSPMGGPKGAESSDKFVTGQGQKQ